MELINRQLMMIDASLSTKKAVFETVCKLLENEGRLLDRDVFLKDIYEREKEGATAPGYAFAIPHAKSKGVKTASLVFIRLQEEMDWTDIEKVKYIFAIAVPSEDANDRHLNILAMLARKMMNEEFRKALSTAQSKEDYYELFSAFDA
jgi:fructose-specific phosphotransferase system IIA component